MTEYILTRSKRKTIGIYIKHGKVEVRAPLMCPQTDIDSFVALKAKWIHNNLRKSKEQAPRVLHYGDLIRFRGEEYPIAAKPGRQIGFDGKCFYMPANLTPQMIELACVKIYRRCAEIYLTGRVAVYSSQMDVAPTAVKISGAKSRWGSCSSKKRINFSWRLMLASDDAIDYVVVHELAHLTHMNHSKSFWAIVEAVLPDYRKRKARLKEAIK